jgi:alpha-N-arabinofuranosidase
VSVRIDPDRIVNRIDDKIYGHFLEHIYNSVNGGLWGELIWNRSFELNDVGNWRVDQGVLTQDNLGPNRRFLFGDAAWDDYEFTLRAKKTGGHEGFLILFRVNSDEEFYWCNLGGWGNARHQIERGLDDGRRWQAVGPSVPGKIESDRWYRIKVRCEGHHIQVWLDDELLLDFTDDRRGPLTGRVGVGTWETQAAFEDLKVVSLTGTVLDEGLPEPTAQTEAAQHWQPYGDGRVTLETDDPLNSDYCQRIVAGQSETGLAQSPFFIRAGETYEGTLWARGRADHALVIRLQAGDRLLAEQQLGKPTGAWRQFPFQFASTEEARDATIQIGVAPGDDVWLDQVSMMPRSWRQAGGYRPDLLRAVAELQPPVIRWPGGCFASPYRWKDAIGPQHQRRSYPRAIWDDQDVNSYGVDELVAMCRQVGAEPLIVVNIGTRAWNPDHDTYDFLQDALDFIEYCNGPATSRWGRVRAANGHPEPYGVKYWEIDNETWHMGAEAYAAAVNRFAPAMKQKDPSVKLIACGSGGYDQQWNRTVIELAGKNFDYISTHHYEDPDNFASGPPRDEAFYRQLQQIIAASDNPDMKIYCSEWNAQSTDWRTGLYCGGILNVFERCGDVFEIGGPALFLRHVSATAWDNAFINFDHTGWFPAPNYVVMKLWREHYAPLRIAMHGETDPLNAVATRSQDGNTLYFKAVNPAQETITVGLTTGSGFAVAQAEMKIVAPGSLRARNSLQEPNRIKPMPGPVTVENGRVRFQLPALSAAVVEIRK